MRKFQFEGKGNVSGDRVRELRLRARLSQTALAAKMQTEGAIIEQDAVSRIESGSFLNGNLFGFSPRDGLRAPRPDENYPCLRRLAHRCRQKPAPGLISRGGYFLQKTIDILQAVWYYNKRKEDKALSKKRKKKSGNKAKPDSYINLVTAILNLVIAILLLIEKLTE